MRQRPAERYGDRPFDRRWLIPLIAGGVVAAALVVAVIVRIADHGVQWAMVSFDTADADAAAATIEVTRNPEDAVTCQLEAVDVRQVIVGQVSVDVPAGGSRTVVVDVEIPLQGDAVAAKITRCQPQQ